MLNLKSYNKPIRALLDVPVKTWGRVVASNYDLQKTILVVATGRGGSTWLGQIIQTVPGYLTLYEPINPRFNPPLPQYGFYPFTYVRTGQDDPEKLDYLYGLMTGRNLNSYMFVYDWFHFSQITNFQGFSLKLIRAHLFLPWFLTHYAVPTIVMLRHPCAVVASQLRHYGWTHTQPQPVAISQELQDDYPHLTAINENIKTQEEALAFIWAIKTWVLMQTPAPHPWHLLTYETLVSNGKHELELIFDYLQRPVPAKAYQQLRVASGSTQTDSPFAQGESALSGWRKSLPSDQIDRILHITHAVGIDFYTNELHPDYKKLGLER